MPAALSMHQAVETPTSPRALQHPPSSHATQCSLRDRRNSLHPLKQHPSSVAAQVDIGSFEDVDFTEPIRPPPSALTSATAYNPHSELPSPLENYASSPAVGHQRSLTGTFFDNCQPFLNRATSTLQQHTSRASTSLHSPTKSLASFIPSRSTIESTASQPKIRAGAKALQSWFNGTSERIQLGVGSAAHYRDESDDDYDSEEDEEDDGNMMASIFNRGPALTRASNESSRESQGPQGPAPSRPQTGSTASNRFAWLLSTPKNASNPPAIPSPTYHNPSDELINLNISQALFPHGPVDPLAPSSFNDLLTTAESLLSRYQTSYRQLSTALVDARAEQSAQDDELDEADTRIRHLKSQLETMATRANDQDEQMRRLMEELMFERKARQEEEAVRKKSLALVRSSAECEHGECMSPVRRRNRISNSDISVDSGFESECETDAASVFSRTNCISPTGTDMSSVHETDDRETTPKGKKPQQLQRRSTYDKVRDGSISLEKSSWGCANCEGGAQASVWGRLAKEREENSLLRRRVGELEEAVDGTLNIVDGPWGV
ncbi:hypothetical protein K458DRAFT_424538 [Lentithecium fluviatile CBS 122367]|uniref:Uncharacterized protein n=1 Tax=Lentithecium fluviatile CBS 122367 TaxID=1168545 RepID=A0A6G1IFQ2_9PLEO|nr:hypothetical protein K458DRAFT_424538 [Lentithecium fluviatile CBS 122367]